MAHLKYLSRPQQADAGYVAPIRLLLLDWTIAVLDLIARQKR